MQQEGQVQVKCKLTAIDADYQHSFIGFEGLEANHDHWTRILEMSKHTCSRSASHLRLFPS